MPTTPLDPARLDRFSVPSLALMQSRKDIRNLAERGLVRLDRVGDAEHCPVTDPDSNR